MSSGSFVSKKNFTDFMNLIRLEVNEGKNSRMRGRKFKLNLLILALDNK